MRGFVLLHVVLYLLAIFSFVPKGDAKGYGVEVRIASPKTAETEPGRILTASFLVTNNAAKEEEFLENINLPDGWQIITPAQFPFTLKSSEQSVRLVAFFLPATAPSGSYEITYAVKSQRDYAITDRDSFQVMVLPVVKLEILLEDKPEVVVAGESYDLKLRIVNRGNCAVKIGLKVEQYPEYPMEIEAKDITLEAGKSQGVRIKITTDEKLNQKINHVIQIKAEAKEIKKGVISAQKSIAVEIIPRVTGALDPFHRIPVRMSFIGIDENGKGGAQVEFSGSGTLDEAGKKRIEFLMRAPDMQDSGVFGQRDEFRFSYRDESLDMHLGDRSYSLSPLTLNYKYGRGAEINLRPGRFGLGAFFLNSRWSEPEERESGGYLKYQFEKFDLKLNLLDAQKSADQLANFRGFNDKIWSLETQIKPNAHTNMEFEYGSCDRAGETSGNAYRVHLNGQMSKDASYSLEKVYAGPKYFGYYNDADYTYTALNFPIYGRLKGTCSYRSYENNLDRDPSKNTATNESSYAVGTRYSFPSGWNASLDYGQFYRQDELVPQSYNFAERTLKLGLGKTLSPKLNFYLNLERGEFENKLTQTKNDELDRYRLFVNFLPTANQRYSLNATSGHDSYTENPQRTQSVGVSGSWRIKNNISCNLSYQKNHADFENFNGSDSLYFNLRYQLPAGRSLSVISRWIHPVEGKQDISSFLTYTIPLGIPVSRKKSIGFLKGKVFDVENGQRQPIHNVILKTNNSTAVTDQNGGFVFVLKPGEYLLSIERKSIGLERVTTVKMPLKVNIRAGQTQEIEIGVVTSCSVSGKITIAESDNNHNGNHEENADGTFKSPVLVGDGKNGNANGANKNQRKEAEGLGNVLVELSDGTETLQEITNGNGDFSFRDIRPGQWTLKVDDNNLPPYHFLEQKEFHFDLKPIVIRLFFSKALLPFYQLQVDKN